MIKLHGIQYFQMELAKGNIQTVLKRPRSFPSIERVVDFVTFYDVYSGHPVSKSDRLTGHPVSKSDRLTGYPVSKSDRLTGHPVSESDRLTGSSQ